MIQGGMPLVTYLGDLNDPSRGVKLDSLLPASVRDNPNYAGLFSVVLGSDGSVLARVVYSPPHTLVNYFQDNGDYFLFTPADLPIPTPEPTSLATIVVGMDALALRRWRRPKSKA